MYSYYGLSALGAEYKKYLWWKKYVTTLQMSQFAIILIHIANIMVRFPNCSYPGPFKLTITLYGILFLYLFADFWVQAYSKPKKNKQKYN
ncbi:Oidioi.mRNA.OKI2018_I69.chr1.g3633.t1.cds [Oikopleura dioica]|uniref:Elongation of very long chain fatty acids protein n=1 Tax=Oikopleura dioica TaxID=34765 RepID=A0ABN7SVD2_OIKDI|nr:Oidioi.mRNA.OKI2018_I69.chr1.g3633.t1.cds [Oikopleura dioica]